MRPNQMRKDQLIDCPTCGRKMEFVLPVRAFFLDLFQVMRFRRKERCKTTVL